MRQALNLLELVKKGSDLSNTGKDRSVCLSSFEAASELFNKRKSKYDTKIDLVLIDHDFIPNLIQENYIDQMEEISDISESADSIAFSDTIITKIRTNQNWSLLQDYATTSSLIPVSFNKTELQTLRFPDLIARGSQLSKAYRLFFELKQSIMHCSLGVCNEAVDVYGECLFIYIINLLKVERVDEAVDLILTYRVSQEMIKEHLPHFSSREYKTEFANLSKSVKSKVSKRIFSSHKSGKVEKVQEESEESDFNMVDIS